MDSADSSRPKGCCFSGSPEASAFLGEMTLEDNILALDSCDLVGGFYGTHANRITDSTLKDSLFFEDS